MWFNQNLDNNLISFELLKASNSLEEGPEESEKDLRPVNNLIKT